MTGKRRTQAAGRRPFIMLVLWTAVLAIVGPPSRRAQAEGDPGGGSEDVPAPSPLTADPQLFQTPPGAAVDYLPAASSVTPAGQFTLTVPIDTPPARGMGPSLAFVYGSHQSSSWMGVGWGLDGLSAITRCRKTVAADGMTGGIKYQATDNYCLDGEKLVVVDPAYEPQCKEYRTERDRFARVVGCGDFLTGHAWFRVWAKDGTILFYEGVHEVPASGEGPTDANDVIAVWPLRDAQDRSGNQVRYSYDVHQDVGDGAGFYYRPLEIEYTRKAAEPPFVDEESGLRKVVFEYDKRDDPSIQYVGGIGYGTPELLTAVNLIAPNPDTPEIVGRYELSYEPSAATGRSLLTEIRRCDRKDGPDKSCLWSKQFSWWQTGRPDFDATEIAVRDMLVPEVSFFSVFDADGDGRDDLLAQLGYLSGQDLEPEIWFFRGSDDPDDHGFHQPVLVNDPYDFETSFHFIDVSRCRAADIDGDGAAELLAFMEPPNDQAPYEDGFHWFRWNGATEHFEPFGEFIPADGASSVALVDLDGNGLIDMLRSEPAPATPAHWLLHRNAGGDLTEWQSTALLAFEPARAVGLDVEGDGRAELFTVDPVDGLDPEHLVPLGFDDGGNFGAMASRWVIQSQPQDSIPPLFADVNGDGLQDALFLYADPKQVRYNTGYRFLPPETLDIAGQVLDPLVSDNGVRVADFDGDGRQDLLSLEAVNDSGQKVMRLILFRAGGIETRDLGFLSGYKPDNFGWATTKTGDFNGDGWLDIVRMPTTVFTSDNGGTSGTVHINVLLQSAPGPENGVSDLLFEVKDEHAPGPRESVFYTTRWSEAEPATQCAYPQLCLRRGFPVVRMVGRSSIEPDARRWTMYDYDDPRADLRGRGFLGFGKVRAFDPQLRAETETTFDHHTRIGELYPFAGLPERTTQITPIFDLPTDGTELPPMPASPLRGHVTSIHRSYLFVPLASGATFHTPVGSWSRTEIETDVAITPTDVEVLAPNTPQERRTEGTLFWDPFGNPTYELAVTLGGGARLTQHVYQNITDDWRIGLLRQTLDQAGDLGDLPSPRETTFEYDDRGRLEVIVVEPGEPDLRRRTHLHRNGDGMVEKVTEAVKGEPIRTTYFAHDDSERMFVGAVWNDLGHYRQMVTHPALGFPVLTQDENGVQVRRQYDRFGRLLRIEPDGGAVVEIGYAADTRVDPDHPHGVAITQQSAGAEQTTYLDERGRLRESATLAFGGQTIFRKTDYNAFGQPVRVHRPGFGAASALVTETTFDSLGRVVSVERPNSDHAEMVYSMFEILRWDFDHHLTRLGLDQEGRVVASERFIDQILTTEYEYGDFGVLTAVRDAEDNLTELSYDKLGRRTLLHDPDRGERTYHYNGFGELIQEDDNDPASPSVVLKHDILGRVTDRIDADGVTMVEYDAPGALGKPWKLHSPDGVSTTLEHDEHGRLIKTTWELASPGAPGLGDGAYAIERDYDEHGRLSELRYPEVPGCNCPRLAIGIDHAWAGGGLHQVRDMRDPGKPFVLWRVQQRNADDLLVNSAWAPEVSGIGTSSPGETRTYDPVLGRLESIATDAGDDEVFHLGYGYDPNGNVTSRTDPIEGRTEIFGYDSGDRLTSWTLERPEGTRHWGYEYDHLDNLEHVTEEGMVVLTHAHGAVVPGVPKPKPHALTTISGAMAQSYHYDERGRQKEGGGRSTAWTELDLPREISHALGTTTFDYDALGARVRKTLIDPTTQLPAESTLTLAGLYERREVVEPASIEHVFYVPGEGGAIAQITYNETTGKETKRYLQRDGLGSVAAVLDTDGTVLDRRFFEPFGSRIEEDGNPFTGGMLSVELGFAGHRHDGDLGLIDMRGRVYDPLQKHFMSPDPVLGAPLSGQDLNRYSYAWNNPLSIVDPTGLDETGGPAWGLMVPLSKAWQSAVNFWNELTGPKPPPPTPPKPPTPPPTPPKTDGGGTAPATGAGAQPSPQEMPPAEKPKPHVPPPSEQQGELVPYNRTAQKVGGFAAGLAIGPVPFGSVAAHLLIDVGVLAPGTPEAREYLVKGEAVGGIVGLLWGAKGPSSGGVQVGRPVPVTPSGGGAAAPLSATPSAVGVVAQAGGAVNVALALTEMAIALSEGGSGGDGGGGDPAAGGAARPGHPALELPGATNTINHIFGKSAHQLEGLVTHFGSREAAYTALYDATQAAVRAQGTTGVFQTAVTVAGQSVTVRGNVIDGVLRLSTAFIP